MARRHRDPHFERAERALESRRGESGPVFTSARRAVSWFLHIRERLQSPAGSKPRDENHVDVDTSGRGDVDTVMATVSDIGRALRLLHVDAPVHYGMLISSVRDGKNHTEIGKKYNCSHGTVSNYIAKAESYIQGALAGSGIIRGSK